MMGFFKFVVSKDDLSMQTDSLFEYLAFSEESKGGSRILKWGVNFCNNVREIKYYFNI